MATLYYRPYTSDLQNDDESNASVISQREGILPDYQYIFDPEKDSIISEVDIPIKPNEGNVVDPDRYKLAMRRMSSEIIYLRDQLKHLMQQNPQQHCNSCGHQKTSQVFIRKVLDANSISKEELVDRYLVLNAKYEEASSELSEYQEKVNKLQLDLIRKNDREAEFLKMNKAHSTQNVLIQNLQKRIQKIKLLEETIKDQEIIIAKMEKQLERTSKVRTRNLSPIIEVRSSRENDYSLALKEENTRLRQEIENVKKNKEKFNITNTMTDSERLELYQLLDKAEQRILALENQVLTNQREWLRERNESTELDEFALSKIKF